MTQRTENEEVRIIVQIKLEEDHHFYYGGGNFCSLNCYDDWARDFMNRAIDQVSGRINEPYILTEENAWSKTIDIIGARVVVMTWDIFGITQYSGREIDITKEEFEYSITTQFIVSSVLDEKS